MKALKFISFVEIGVIVFELWEAEINHLTGHIHNTLVFPRVFSAVDT